MIPRKAKIHQYFETALIIDFPPSKNEYALDKPFYLNHQVATNPQFENTLKLVDRQGKYLLENLTFIADFQLLNGRAEIEKQRFRKSSPLIKEG